MALLESQCTFIYDKNGKKKFLTSHPVAALILFNKEHQDLFQTASSFGVRVGEHQVREKG